MTPRYGERSRAFLRLQELIFRQHRDASMFAWRLFSHHNDKGCGLLASSPKAFINCSKVQVSSYDSDIALDQFRAMGRLPSKRVSGSHDTYLVRLNAKDESLPGRYAIVLRYLGEDRYMRVRAADGTSLQHVLLDGLELRNIEIQQGLVPLLQKTSRAFWIDIPEADDTLALTANILSRCDSHGLNELIMAPTEEDGKARTAGVIQFETGNTRKGLLPVFTRIKFGFNHLTQPVLRLYHHHPIKDQGHMEMLKNAQSYPEGSSLRQNHERFDDEWIGQGNDPFDWGTAVIDSSMYPSHSFMVTNSENSEVNESFRRSLYDGHITIRRRRALPHVLAKFEYDEAELYIWEVQIKATPQVRSSVLAESEFD